MTKIQSILATILTTTTLVGAIIESAEAGIVRGKGSKTRASRINDVDLNYKFDLYAIDLSGQPRVDEDGNPTNNMGIFTGAIENFTVSITDTLEVDETLPPPGTFKEFTRVNISTPAVLDLQAILNPGSSIEYILTGEPLSSEGITELALIINDFSDTKFDLDFSGVLEDDEFDFSRDSNQAVNSIEEIINKGLLGQIDAIRLSTETASSQNEVDFFGDNPPESEVIPDRVVDIPDPTVVPESNTTNSLLALGLLGTGLLIKQIKSKLIH